MRRLAPRPSRRAPDLDLDRLEDRTTPATLPTGFTEAAVATGLASRHRDGGRARTATCGCSSRAAG